MATLQCSTWENPPPEKPIVRLEIIAKRAYALFAIIVE